MAGRRDFLKRGAAGIGALAVGGAPITAPALASGNNIDPRHYALIVLDRSGSMLPMRSDVVDGINKLLDDNSSNKNMYIGVVQFDSNKTSDGCFCEPIFGFTESKSTPRLSLNDYQPRGGTPLLAAFAEAISKLEQVVRKQDRALVVIQTDGEENSSPAEITKEVIRKLIDAKTAEGNWTFSFMGADIDAWGTGGSLGINQASTLTFSGTQADYQRAYNTLSASASSWYVTTGGGQSYVESFAAPTNTNSSFFSVKDVSINASLDAMNTKSPRKPKREQA